MINFGIAKAQVQITDTLPEVDHNPTFPFFDFNAASVPTLYNEEYRPVLVQTIFNDNKRLCAAIPQIRNMMINNYLNDGSIAIPGSPPSTTTPAPITPAIGGSAIPYILWTPVISDMPINSTLKGGTFGGSVLGGLISDTTLFPSYVLGSNPPELVSTTTTTTTPSSTTTPTTPTTPTVTTYISPPKWATSDVQYEPTPDDKKIMDPEFQKIFGTTVPFPSSTTFPKGDKIKVVSQKNVRAGLWWAIESSKFLDKNTPFSVNIRKDSAPPCKEGQETFIMIALGSGSSNGDDRIDFVISMNHKPKLFDYRGTTNSSSSGSGSPSSSVPVPITTEFDNELSRIFSTESNIDISFMTVAGRLFITANKSVMVYDRPSPDPKTNPFVEVYIPAGEIRIYGTNISATIRAAPMSFATAACIYLKLQDLSNVASTPPASGALQYKAINTESNIINSPVCVLPKDASDLSGGIGFPIHYGVDCKDFIQPGVGSASIGGDPTASPPILPQGFGFHGNGRVKFLEIPKPSGMGADESIYAIVMYPQFVNFPGFGTSFQYLGGCPYVFKLKGGAKKTNTSSIGYIDASEDVISAEENASANDDMSHVRRTATVTLYNKGGTYDFCKRQQKGVILSWGWNGHLQRTFTGVVTSVSSSETPGKETLTLTCQDYMYILENSPMINSPLYDGMLACYAMKDLVQRAGIKGFVLDADFAADPTAYTLPSGFSFSAPAMRFQDYSKIFDNLNNIAQRGTVYFYFDELGKFHVNKIPGGLAGYPSGGVPIPAGNQFNSDPSSGNPVILDDRNIEVDFDSTVNTISAMTLHRDTNAYIIYGISAGASSSVPNDYLLFRKISYQDQPAWGDVNVMEREVNTQAQRMFYPTRSISFKIIGNSSASTILQTLQYITVDGIQFRLISLKRSYNAENNEFIQSYEGEWLGGA